MEKGASDRYKGIHPSLEPGYQRPDYRKLYVQFLSVADPRMQEAIMDAAFVAVSTTGFVTWGSEADEVYKNAEMYVLTSGEHLSFKIMSRDEIMHEV